MPNSIWIHLFMFIEKPEECDEEYEQLLEEYTTLLLEEEELRIIG